MAASPCCGSTGPCFCADLGPAVSTPAPEPMLCDWLIEVRRPVTDEMVEAGWYPDFPSDLVMEVECGLPMHPHGPDGWICANGHEFGNMERRYAPFGDEWQAEQAERDGVF